jgi:hypothetical protein
MLRKRMLENTHLYHVYHPFDTVAYRVDPHLNELFAQLDPLEVHTDTSKFKFKSPIHEWSDSIKKGWGSLFGSGNTTTTTTTHTGDIEVQKIITEEQHTSDITTTTTVIQTTTIDPSTIENVRLEPNVPVYDKKQLEKILENYHRVDHALKPTWDQELNEYFVTGDVHLKYYENKDVVAFILKKLGRL